MIKIGNIELGEKLLLLAPMEDVTDVSFRLLMRQMGADAVYTEFISSEALIRSIAKSRKKLVTMEEERPVAIQIYGGNPDVMREAAQISEEAGPDFIDINCGCWVKNVAGKGAGAGLLKDPERMERMVRAVVDSVKLPVTVKTRIGWDHDTINILEIAPMLEQAGAKALTIHCRTRAQGHNGEADWTWIPKIKQVVSIPVFLNGDVKSPEDADRAFRDTGCDGVMIARGAITNPFVFEQILEYRRTGTYTQPSLEKRINTCIRHLRHSCQIRGAEHGVFAFRKHYAGYLREVPGGSRVRSELMQLTPMERCIERLEHFKEHGGVVVEQAKAEELLAKAA